MFLKMDGITGEARDDKHAEEIEVMSWSWGIQGSTDIATGQASAKARIGELQIVKRVDLSSTTLMQFANYNKLVKEAKLTVRKAGKEPLEYLIMELTGVRVTAVKVESTKDELVERVNLSFAKVLVTYTPQLATGAGGKKREFQADVFGHQ